jgi:hypothetical protein
MQDSIIVVAIIDTHQTLRLIRENGLHINDWKAYIVSEIIPWGIPAPLIGAVTSLTAAILHRRTASPQDN